MNRKIIPFRNIMVSNDENGVTYITLGSCQLEQWLKQNNAEYTGDFLPGCLLDNFVVVTARGFAAVYESYLNSCSSQYYIEFQSGAAQTVWANWYQFEKDYKESEDMTA